MNSSTVSICFFFLWILYFLVKIHLLSFRSLRRNPFFLYLWVKTHQILIRWFWKGSLRDDKLKEQKAKETLDCFTPRVLPYSVSLHKGRDLAMTGTKKLSRVLGRVFETIKNYFTSLKVNSTCLRSFLSYLRSLSFSPAGRFFLFTA